ncbi:MerR family transcriptional regulator [Paenibacillus sp. DMB5]|uniref:MerR family transcriptional regulator n=1 Tax=Paenibacillus sp. DMB5 TaxID=1780103 RepID=UPI000A739B2D|nr:MerR family transcriptional regulator [Paenibacillus sp. DMB5]
MKYSIGEFASILGITADTLRLYEKHDIVKPEKGCRNNYRYFNDLDARNLLSSRWYRSMQIPLQNVAELVSEAPAERVVESIYAAQLQLEEEIRRSTMLLDKINSIHKGLTELGDTLYKCRIKQMAGMYRLQQTDKNQLLQKECLKQRFRLGWSCCRSPSILFARRIRTSSAQAGSSITAGGWRSSKRISRGWAYASMTVCSSFRPGYASHPSSLPLMKMTLS